MILAFCYSWVSIADPKIVRPHYFLKAPLKDGTTADLYGIAVVDYRGSSPDFESESFKRLPKWAQDRERGKYKKLQEIKAYWTKFVESQECKSWLEQHATKYYQNYLRELAQCDGTDAAKAQLAAKYGGTTPELTIQIMNHGPEDFRVQIFVNSPRMIGLDSSGNVLEDDWEIRIKDGKEMRVRPKRNLDSLNKVEFGDILKDLDTKLNKNHSDVPPPNIAPIVPELPKKKEESIYNPLVKTCPRENPASPRGLDPLIDAWKMVAKNFPI